MDDEFYTGPVCYMDGWHYTVVEDEAGREYATAVAQAAVARAEKRGDADALAAAQAELADMSNRNFEMPGERLHLEDTDDGTESRYRLATDADTRSWHDRKHQQFATVELEDGTAAARVTPAELEAIQRVLGEMRGTG